MSSAEKFIQHANCKKYALYIRIVPVSYLFLLFSFISDIIGFEPGTTRSDESRANDPASPSGWTVWTLYVYDKASHIGQARMYFSPKQMWVLFGVASNWGLGSLLHPYTVLIKVTVLRMKST